MTTEEREHGAEARRGAYADEVGWRIIGPMRATALVLDRGHRGRRVECEVSAGVRPLAALTDAIRAAGIELDFGGPIGVRSGESARFLFVLPWPGEGDLWRPLPEWARDEGAWRLYVDAMLGGWEPPTRELDVFFFGDGPPLAAKLAHLVAKGAKRGTTCWIAAAERDGSPLPRAGAVSIVTDGFGHALCAIRTESVERRPFRDVDEEMARTEGEGDRTLADWRAAHLDYFHREAASLGLAFDEDQEVLFERFRVVAVLGRAD